MSRRLLVGLGGVALILIMSSAFLVYALAPTITQFVRSASSYTRGYSDQQLLTIYSRGSALLDFNQQSALKIVTETDVLDILRGTPRGIALVDSFTPDQTEAANALLALVFDTSCESTSVAGSSSRTACALVKPWDKARVCAPPPAGRCTPGHRTCQDATDSGRQGDWACSYVCGPGGRWITPTECTHKVCGSTQAC